MEESVGVVVLEFVKQFGWGVFTLLFVAYQLIGHWDIVRNFFRESDKTKNDEREQLSEDTQRLIENLTGDSDRQRKWRIEESSRYERTIVNLRGELIRKDRIIESIEKGNSRLRHALNNALTCYANLTRKAELAGIVVPPFSVDEFMTLDPDYYKHLKEILGDNCD